MEIDSALTAVQTLRSELQDAKQAAASGQLKPLPGESVRVLFSLSVFVSGSLPGVGAHLSLPLSPSVGEVRSGSGQHLQVSRRLDGAAAHLRCTRKRTLHRSVPGTPRLVFYLFYFTFNSTSKEWMDG